MLMQWISYFMIFSVLVIFILEYPLNEKLDWRFYGTVLALGVLLVINILWFQSHEQLDPPAHSLLCTGRLISLPTCWYWEPSRSPGAAK